MKESQTLIKCAAMMLLVFWVAVATLGVAVYACF